MATAAEVVAAIDHISRYKPDWRGTLNDSDFAALNDMYQRAKLHPEEWLMNSDLPLTLDDKYLGALRLDNPTLFDGAAAVDPPASPASPGALPVTSEQKPTEVSAECGLSGRAAEAAQRVDDALAKNTSVLVEADEELVDAVLGAKTGSEQGRAQLQALQSALVDQIHKLGPTLDTPAGQQQLTDFLQGKTQEILGVVTSSGMDAESKTEVLDALSQRYDAVQDSAGSGTGAGPADPAGGGSGQTGSGTNGSTSSAPSDGGAGASDTLATDPLLSGLASDPLMAGLGGLAGPAMGALSGLPAAMGSMMPGMGGALGGGLPLGDLGGAIGGAIKDASASAGEDPAAVLNEDSPSDTPEDGVDRSGTEETGSGEDDNDRPETDPVAAKPGDGEQPQPVAADIGQIPPSPPGPEVSVALPDGSTATAESPQLAHAGRLILEGASLDDAAGQAQITVLPPGAPVNEPVSPSQLRLMDYAQFTDHRVLALGGGKVWLNGQVTAVEEMPTGPNFLGWARPQVQMAPVATVPAGAV